MQGMVVGSYRILGEIGAGGMGTIYRAEHTLLGRPAAVKVLNPPYAQSRAVVTRFFNEAKAATAIQHPGIVEVFDFGYLPDGAAYIVMELLAGESLGRRLHARGTLLETEAFAILRQCAGALGAAHARGIVHRDIKPDNVFLVPDPEMPSGERIKLLDFGIAKLTDEATGSTSQTRTGTVLGTPSYMAPEQCSGAGNVDHRADLYSLGCMLFELIAGRPPFVGHGAGEIIGAHQFVAAPRLRDLAPGASRDADELCAMLLAKRPEDRVQTATDLIRLLGARGNVKATGSHHHVSVGATGEIQGSTTLGGAAVSLPSPSSLAAPPPRRRRTGILVGAVGAVAIAAIAVIAASNGGGSSTPAAGSSAAPAGSSAAPAGSSQRSAAPPPPPSDQGAVAKLLADARAAIDDSKWAAAAAAADAVLQLEPDNPDARTLAMQAKHETVNANTYDAFQEAAAGGRYERAVSTFEQLPNDSVYKNRARDAYDQMHAQFLTEQQRAGQALARARKCTELRRLAADAGKVFPDVGDTIAGIACNRDAPPTDNPKPPKPPKPTSPTGGLIEDF